MSNDFNDFMNTPDDTGMYDTQDIQTNKVWAALSYVGILFILRFLEPLRNDLFFLFAGSTVVATVLEYATNRFLEGLTGTKWWDYSGYLLNLDGRICAEGLLVFGIGGIDFGYNQRNIGIHTESA